MMLRFRRWGCLALAAVLLFLRAPGVASAQSVGLALSGGGAKGMAHIGVIKALEDNGIPIDYVAGTSIGSIVGSLYAIGYGPEEILAFFKSQAFRDWSQGKVPEQYQYAFKEYKNDGRMVTLSLRWVDSVVRVVLPSHLINTTQMDLGIMEMASPPNALAGQNFDSLFRPFRCVASDPYNKREKVFRSGNLGMSVRASMTYPLLFPTIEIDSTMYFDGGIYNNYPWNVLAKDFHPDVLIGSNVSGASPKPESSNVLSQIEILVMNPTDYKMPDSLGVSINMHLEGVGVMDFDQLDSLVAVGYQTTMEKLPAIRARIARRADTATLSQERAAYRAKLPALIYSNDIILEGVKSADGTYIRETISRNRNAFSHKAFVKEYYKLYADASLESIYPSASYDSLRQLFQLRLKVQRAWPLDICLGGNISSRNNNQIFIGVDYKVLRRISGRAFGYGTLGSYHSNAHLGWRQDFQLPKQFYYQLGYQFNHLNYESGSPIAIFKQEARSSLKIRDTYLYAHLGFPLSYNSQGKLAVNLGTRNDTYYLVKNFSKFDEPDKNVYDYLYAGLDLQRASYNYRALPTEGKGWNIRLGYMLIDEENVPGTTSNRVRATKHLHQWASAHANTLYFTDFTTKRFTLGLSGAAQLTLRSKTANYSSDLLTSPAFTPTLSSKSMFIEQLRSLHYAAGGLLPTVQILPNFYIQGQAYAFLPFLEMQEGENQQTVYRKLTDGLYFFGNISLFYQTFLGPVSLTLDYLPNFGNSFLQNLLVGINFGFPHFEKLGMTY